MKKFDVKIQTIKENIISVNAHSRREAISKIKRILMSSNIDEININGITRKNVFVYDDKNDQFDGLCL